MPLSTLLHLECDPVEPVDAMKHVVFSCPQSQGANLEQLPTIASQRFAVMYDAVMGDHLIEMLERAHSAGALPPVKLIAVREHGLYIFLDASVASATLPAIARLWESVVVTDIEWPWSVSFALETEVGTGHSDFEFWDDAKDILESYSLGIGSLDSSDRDLAKASVYADQTWDLSKVALEAQPQLAEGNVLPTAHGSDDNRFQSPGAVREQWVGGVFPADSKLLTCANLDAMKDAMNMCPSLREKCLRAFLMSSARVAEITSIKVQDVSFSANRISVTLHRVKNGKPKLYMLPLGIPPALISRYVQESQLSPEDYLFPSKLSASKPMSTRKVHEEFSRWLIDAEIKHDDLNVHSFRRTLTMLEQLVKVQTIRKLMGHVSMQAMTEYYCSPRASRLP